MSPGRPGRAIEGGSIERLDVIELGFARVHEDVAGLHRIFGHARDRILGDAVRGELRLDADLLVQREHPLHRGLRVLLRAKRLSDDRIRLGRGGAIEVHDVGQQHRDGGAVRDVTPAAQGQAIACTLPSRVLENARLAETTERIIPSRASISAPSFTAAASDLPTSRIASRQSARVIG